MSYTSLHCHSDYSNIRMLDSINQLPLLFERARELKLKGLAITDHETLSGHIKAIQYIKQQREKYKNKYEAEENVITPACGSDADERPVAHRLRAGGKPICAGGPVYDRVQRRGTGTQLQQRAGHPAGEGSLCRS